jgi:hypothetical protein
MVIIKHNGEVDAVCNWISMFGGSGINIDVREKAIHIQQIDYNNGKERHLVCKIGDYIVCESGLFDIIKQDDQRKCGIPVELYNEIIEWQDRTFPKATPSSILEHLRREVKELSRNRNDSLEYADCYFLTLHMVCRMNQYQEKLRRAASNVGIDIEKAIRDKFKINKERLWKEPDSQGVYEHHEG